MDADFYHIKAKLLANFKDTNTEIKKLLTIERSLDPNCVGIPIRQAKIFSFININETKRLWKNALERSEQTNHNNNFYINHTWRKIVLDAKLHPVLIKSL